MEQMKANHAMELRFMEASTMAPSVENLLAKPFIIYKEAAVVGNAAELQQQLQDVDAGFVMMEKGFVGELLLL